MHCHFMDGTEINSEKRTEEEVSFIGSWDVMEYAQEEYPHMLVGWDGLYNVLLLTPN